VREAITSRFLPVAAYDASGSKADLTEHNGGSNIRFVEHSADSETLKTIQWSRIIRAINLSKFNYTCSPKKKTIRSSGMN
jgi:hypothetical protein